MRRASHRLVAGIPAVVYGALVEFAGFTCPLTLLENDLRRHAGEAGHAVGGTAAGTAAGTVVDTRHDRLPGA